MNGLGFSPDCRTTAMGILPHTNVEEALDLALSLDIPFWPQLPRLSYFEDMYVQALDHFPGILIDPTLNRIHFDLSRFYAELPAYVEKVEDPETFRLTEAFSLVYHRFLEKDLSHYSAIRGQVISPISLGLKVVDENQRPIIYHDEVRDILFDFIGRKVNQQVQELRRKHPQAFVWLDDPGLGLIFTAFSGYNEGQARADLDQFLLGLEGPRGIHLCARPDWDFLLKSRLDILSFDSFTCGVVIVNYRSLKEFLDRGGVISWGIVPTATEVLQQETPDSLMAFLEKLWGDLVRKGVGQERLLHQSLLAPATCNLMNVDGEKTVKKSFEVLVELSHRIRRKYNLA